MAIGTWCPDRPPTEYSSCFSPPPLTLPPPPFAAGSFRRVTTARYASSRSVSRTISPSLVFPLPLRPPRRQRDLISLVVCAGWRSPPAHSRRPDPLALFTGVVLACPSPASSYRWSVSHSVLSVHLISSIGRCFFLLADLPNRFRHHPKT